LTKSANELTNGAKVIETKKRHPGECLFLFLSLDWNDGECCDWAKSPQFEDEVKNILTILQESNNFISQFTLFENIV
jgi:hypothetical protein